MRRLLPLLLALFAVTSAPGQDTDVEVTSFGLNGRYRPGDITPIQLTVSSGFSEVTSFWVQIEIPNADGDVGEYGRSITLPAAQRQSLWLAVPLPPDFTPSDLLPVRVFEERDGERRGEITTRRIGPASLATTPISPTMSLILVVGETNRTLGLNQYPFPQQGLPITAGEYTAINSGLRPEDLPDTWDALLSYEAIVWSSFRPSELGDVRARALKRYVERGGHLVVIVSDETAGSWTATTGNSTLDELMPSRRPRTEQITITDLLHVTSKARPSELADLLIQPINPNVVVFGEITTVAEDLDAPWLPLQVLEDGRIISIHRSYGFGRVTLVGLEPSLRLLALPGGVQTDIFWNRILGRRMDTPTNDELAAIKNADRLSTRSYDEITFGGGSLVAGAISMNKQVALGVAAVLIFFIAYWLVTTGSFFVLKQYRLHRHAWLAFAAGAALFTAAAWGMVSLIKPSTYTIQHLTVLDIRHPEPGDSTDVPQHRAMSWFSLNMPGYRRVPVLIEQSPRQRDVLHSWIEPGGQDASFPNPDRFRVDVLNPPAAPRTVEEIHDGDPAFYRPSRATTSPFAAHWMGDLDPDFGSFHVNPANPPRLELDEDGNEILVGEISHDFPVTATRVRVYWIESKLAPKRTYVRRGAVTEPWINARDSGNLRTTGRAFVSPNLDPATPLQFEIALDRANLAPGQQPRDEPLSVMLASIADKFANRSMAAVVSSSLNHGDRMEYLGLLGLYNLLPPPTYLTTPDKAGPDTASFFRVLGREMDISGWMTRPCLLITAELRGVPSPVPVRVGGQTPEPEGDSTVLVRFIYPLGLRPEIAYPEAFEQNDADDES